MALTNGAVVARRTLPDAFEVKLSFSGDNAYPTNGTAEFSTFVRATIAADNAAKGDANIRGYENLTLVEVIAGECGVYVPQYDYTNDKLFVKDGSAAFAEVGNGTDLNATTFNLTVVCK